MPLFLINRTMDLDTLYSKKEPYTEEEVAFVKSKHSKSNFKVKYAFYNKESSKGLYLALILDRIPYATRRSGLENNWEVISERNITNIEFDEQMRNYGCSNRRFTVWYYRDIEAMVDEEKKCYNVDVPEEYVKQAKERGYSGSFQTRILFD